MTFNGETVYFVWGYRPIVTTAIEWSKASNGNWFAYDRGASIDFFESEVSFKGPLSELTDLETALGTGRENFNITCGTGEEIFGADIDYSSAIDVTVTRYSKINRVSKAQYSMSLRLRALSTLTFIGSASLSGLKIGRHNYISDSDYDISKSFSYDGTAYYYDRANDEGTFKAQFIQTTTEARDIRRYLLTSARSASLPFPSIGITYPFGTRSGSGPFNCKITDWSEGPRVGLKQWSFNITFRREF